jgi:hypothetical protein
MMMANPFSFHILVMQCGGKEGLLCDHGISSFENSRTGVVQLAQMMHKVIAE